MRPRRAAVLLALCAAPAWGQVVSPAPDQTAVTIYRLTGDPGEDADVRLEETESSEGLAMIREVRTVDLPAGRSRISFRGVADTMVPQTAAVEGLPGAVIERNQDYDLLTVGALVEASVGKTVRLVRTNPKTGEVTSRAAVLRAGANGPLLEVDGRIEAFGCSGLHERLVFDSVPPDLAERPTFSVLAEAPTAGRYRVSLSYLATGLAWSADYVAQVRPDGATLDLTGWITLTNQTSASFVNAPTDVVAGNLARDDDETAPPEFEATSLDVNCWPAPRKRFADVIEEATGARVRFVGGGGGEGLEEIVVTGQRLARLGELGDYKLYTVPEPTTVAARQTKQAMFLRQEAVPFERVYAYRFDIWEEEEGPQPANVVLRMRNEARRGLGKPLPAGLVTVMEPGAYGPPVLAGQRRIKDVAVGLPVEVELGRAMDVWVTVRVAEEEDARGGRERRVIEAEFANDKPGPVVLEYRQSAEMEAFRLDRASRRAGRKAGDPAWTVRLKPGERATLRYEISYDG